MTINKTKFTKAFKLEALQLASQPNTCIASLARDLGIRRNMIYKWREINWGQCVIKRCFYFKNNNLWC